MNKLCGVYSITCVSNNKQYVGSSINITDRWKHHRTSLVRGDHGNRYLQRTWDKYGPTKLIFEVIELCQSNELVDKELFWTRKLQTAFNLKIPNPIHEGWIWSKETRAKMSLSAMGHHNGKGVKRSKETRYNVAMAAMGNSNAKGWVPTFEQRQKMSKAHLKNPTKYWLGKKRPPFSKEWKRKISEASKKMWQTKDMTKRNKKVSEALRGIKRSKKQKVK